MLSPALGRLLAADATDWLSGPSEIVVPQKALSNNSNSNSGVQERGASVEVPFKGKENHKEVDTPGSRKPQTRVRQSLFDLARLQLDEFTHM
jgi:hypothetical protein